jgi:hypothetical protein
MDASGYIRVDAEAKASGHVNVTCDGLLAPASQCSGQKEFAHAFQSDRSSLASTRRRE